VEAYPEDIIKITSVLDTGRLWKPTLQTLSKKPQSWIQGGCGLWKPILEAIIKIASVLDTGRLWIVEAYP
jgi:hypothetical protein